MSLGFTKSDPDPKFYYKVVDGDMLILVLYVDDMFLTGHKETHFCVQEGVSLRVRNEGSWLDALFLGIGGVAETR
jgi:hypothetical protein